MARRLLDSYFAKGQNARLIRESFLTGLYQRDPIAVVSEINELLAKVNQSEKNLKMTIDLK